MHANPVVRSEPVLGRFPLATPRTASVLGLAALLLVAAAVPLAVLSH